MIDELDLIRRSMDDVGDPDATTEQRVRARLDTLISGAGTNPTHRRRRTRRPTRRLALAAMSATAIVALVVAVFVSRQHSSSPSSAVRADAPVGSTAAPDDPDGRPLQPGEYAYTRSEGIQLAGVTGNDTTFRVRAPFTREIWIASDGSGRIVTRYGPSEFPSDLDRQSWEAAGRPSLPTDDDKLRDFGPGELYYDDLFTLPTDPEVLKARLAAGEVPGYGRASGDHQMFVTVGDLLRETNTSAAVRGALFRILTGLDAVTDLGPTRDTLGREGIAVASDDPSNHGLRNELLFDPHTFRLLEERSVITDPASTALRVSAGTVISTATYTDWGITSSTTEPPS